MDGNLRDWARVLRTKAERSAHTVSTHALALPCTSPALHEPCLARALPCTSPALHEPCASRALPCTSPALHEPRPLPPCAQTTLNHTAGSEFADDDFSVEFASASLHRLTETRGARTVCTPHAPQDCGKSPTRFQRQNGGCHAESARPD